jgi:hypothetical protein
LKTEDSIFFIFYLSRSGSTFLAKELCDNFPVVIPPESNAIEKLIRNKKRWNVNLGLQILKEDSKFQDWNLDIVELEKLTSTQPDKTEFIRILCQLYQNSKTHSGSLFGIKKGNYISIYKELKTMFPNAKFLILIRDGRAIFNSQKNSTYSVTQRPFETNATKAAKAWKNYMQLAVEIKATFPESTKLVRYESMVENANEVLQDIAKFLELEKGDSVMNYQVPDRYGKNLHQNIGKSPMQKAISKWKDNLPLSEIKQYEAVAGKELENNQYDLITQLSSFNRLRARLGI